MTTKKDIIVAVITALASIASALLGSQLLVRGNIDKLEISQDAILESKTANVEYQAPETGFVFALARADQKHRSIQIQGFIGPELVASTMAQDSYIEGVPSIGDTSFAMPVPKDSKWKVETTKENAAQVQVKWFVARSRINKNH
jgi:hypothetical protein